MTNNIVKTKCKICESETRQIFTHLVLNKHQVNYFQCPNCNFLFTEEPYWLDEAYKESISTIDIGYCTRNIYMANITSSLLRILKVNHKKDTFLDYGGGYGLFARLMRDRGYNFYNHDKHTKNIFSTNFDKQSTDFGDHQLITSFEVFEHLINPKEILTQLLNKSNYILISTELQPSTDKDKLLKWRYLLPSTGQHISLYHKKTIGILGEVLGVYYYSNSKNLHLYSKKKLSLNWVKFTYYMNEIKDVILQRNFHNPHSLLPTDYYNMTHNKLSNK